MIAALILLALAVPADTAPPLPAASAPALFDPVTGYRQAQYRGVVPSPPPGIRRIENTEAAALADTGKALLIDVTPAAGGQRDAATGVWRLAEAHDSIPGAHWFPEAGRGPPDPAIDAWFARGVKRLARSRHHTIMVFCLADCWMSWNASWKLKRLGYTDVRWFANGADGWRDIDRSLQPVTPER